MIASRRLFPCLALLLCTACGDADTASGDPPTSESMMDPTGRQAQLRARAARSFEALESPKLPEAPRASRLFELGRALFFEKRLSVDGQVSCGTCHMREFGGADGIATALGVSGHKSVRNAATVFNAALQLSQHWHGDRTSLADQAARSPLAAAWFGNTDEAEVIGRLRAADYQAAFERAFPESASALSLANLGAAIAAYEQTLITPGRFDAFLNGDDEALDARELAGLELFMEVGCSDCHGGPGLGGEQLAKFGLQRPYEEATGSPVLDQGRFDATQLDADRFVFKVPMLRNVAQTAPYFHDGYVVGLAQAVRVMLDVQLGKRLQDFEVENLVAFLGALSGPAPDWFSAP